MRQFKLLFAIAIALFSLNAPAQSVQGYVERIQVEPTGRLWFRMEIDPKLTAPYCQVGWYGFSMYIPKESPEYPYYFAMLMTAFSKRKQIFVENLSYSGTNAGNSACDISKTGYGIVILQ